MARTVVVPLVDGFEEIEAVTIIDVLRRADVPVIIAGGARGEVVGAHDIVITADHALSEIDAADVAMVVLPGGMPGAANLAANPDVQRLIKAVAPRGTVAAICAAPMALGAAGVVAGKTATCYPGFEDKVTGARLVNDRVVVDGKVVTSRGPGTALEFALTLVGLLAGKEAEAGLSEGMLVHRPAPARIVQ